MSTPGPMKKSDIESADNACETPLTEPTNETRDPDAETLRLTAAEGRLLRRLALTIKSRCANVWRDRAKIGRLPMLQELTHIRESCATMYEVLTDATWREFSDTTEERKV